MKATQSALYGLAGVEFVNLLRELGIATVYEALTLGAEDYDQITLALAVDAVLALGLDLLRISLLVWYAASLAKGLARTYAFVALAADVIDVVWHPLLLLATAAGLNLGEATAQISTLILIPMKLMHLAAIALSAREAVRSMGRTLPTAYLITLAVVASVRAIAMVAWSIAGTDLGWVSSSPSTYIPWALFAIVAVATVALLFAAARRLAGPADPAHRAPAGN